MLSTFLFRKMIMLSLQESESLFKIWNIFR